MEGKEAYRVMLVDSYGLLLGGFQRMIDSDPRFEVVVQANNLDDAERRAMGHKPDIILIGFNLFAFGEEVTQADLIKLVKSVSPKSLVLVLVRSGGRMQTVRQAMTAGADGALSAGLNKRELLDALAEVVEQGSYFSAGMTLEMMREKEEQPLPISQREKEILIGVACGHTNQEVADRLFLSIRTVEAHRAALQTKLDLHTRAELVSYAVRHHLIQPTSPWLNENHD